MNTEQSENAITVSALVVTGIFAYRRAVEPVPNFNRLVMEGKGGVRSQNLAKDYKSLFGAAPPVEWGQFLKAAGSLYIALSVIGQINPDIGGAAAILIGTSAVIGNGIAVMNDLHGKESETERLASSELNVKATQNREKELAKTFGPKVARELMQSER